MSVSYHIGCYTCKEYLWIGQSDIIYTGEPHTMRALTEFLHKHESNKITGEVEHQLVFGPEWFDEYWGADENRPWKEIDANDYKEVKE